MVLHHRPYLIKSNENFIAMTISRLQAMSDSHNMQQCRGIHAPNDKVVVMEVLVYLRDGSAKTIVYAAAPRQKLQIKLSTSPKHSILISGQLVPVLSLQCQAPGKTATRVSSFKSLWYLLLLHSQAISLGFTIFGEIFAYVIVF